MIRPHFNAFNRFEIPTVILCNRNKHKLGRLYPIENYNITPNMTQTNELSFRIHKYNDNQELPLWDKIIDHKLLYIPEYNEYFELTINMDYSNDTIKTITAQNLGVVESSQTILYDIEINTEDDIARDDYEIATIWDTDKTKQANTLLGRVISKMPHYKVKHVDSTLINIVRSFSISGKSVYDFLSNDLANEINCLAVVGSDRTISLYDLEDSCNDCHYRQEDMDVCPKCNSSNITRGYGENTSILISLENLTQQIQVGTNGDEVKNVFRVRGGDDLINAAVRGINPNGSDYIYNFSDEMYEDMDDELVDKLNSYNELYNSLQPSYTEIIENIYDAIDQILYLESEMSPEPYKHTLDEEVKLIEDTIKTISVQTLRLSGQTTVNNAIRTYAEAMMDSEYKVEIKESTYSTGSDTWKGVIRVVYKHPADDAEEEDTYRDTKLMTVAVNEDYENFVKQKIEKIANKESIEELCKIKDDDLFKAELKKYGLHRLSSYSDAYQSCLDVMIEIGENEKTHEFYGSIYTVYYQRKQWIDAEILVREGEIKVQENLRDGYISQRDAIQDSLNIKNYLGDLYYDFCAYRREDEYSNDNYISDGLNNAELLKKAQELFEVAQKEIYKASQVQYTISTSIGDLFAIEELSAWRDNFIPGSWMRVKTDDGMFKIRLLDYTIADSDLSKLSVNLSNVTKIKDGVTDLKSVIDSAKSMASSYDTIKHQAKKSEETTQVVGDWVQDGLDATKVAVVSSANQEITYDDHGLLGREYDEITESYAPEQVKLINNVLAFTDDKWETIKTALGKIYYTNPTTGELTSAYGLLADVIIGKLILGEALGIYNEGGSLKFDKNGLEITNGINTFTVNPNADNLFTIKKGNNNIIYMDSQGNASFKGDIQADSLTLASSIKIGTSNINGLANVATSGSYNDLSSQPDIVQITKDTITAPYINAMKITAGSVAAENITGTTISGKTISGGSINIGNGTFTVDSSGNMKSTSATITGSVTANTLTANSSGSIAGWKINSTSLSNNVSQTFPTYTSADIQRMQQIIIGLISPTQDDYNRYDLDYDGKITSRDVVLVQRFVYGYDSNPLTGSINLNSNSLKSTIYLSDVNNVRDTSIGAGYINTKTLSSKVLTCDKIYNSEIITDNLTVGETYINGVSVLNSIKKIFIASSIIEPGGGNSALLISNATMSSWGVTPSNSAVFISNGNGEKTADNIYTTKHFTDATLMNTGWWATFMEKVDGKCLCNWMLVSW